MAFIGYSSLDLFWIWLIIISDEPRLLLRFRLGTALGQSSDTLSF